ncbi:cyclic nucleotide-binding domain-containing protein [Bacillus sp. JJ927]|uniref:cyclic nucleotide-binding domain-containing protein n=1 Tax=Bacillus sp. JJ927 TaxID=3122976 RepID=UPI0033915B29
MRKICNSNKLADYIKHNNIDAFFSSDMKPYMELIFFKKNEFICRENEEIDYLYFFVEGKAKAFNTLSNGKSVLLCFYDSLQLLGDVELIHSQKISSNVQVMVDSYCVGLPLGKVRNQLFHDATFLKCICGSLAQKLHRLSKNSTINLLYPLENRLASYMLAAGERAEQYDNRIVFNGNLTETAELLGTSYRHLLRTLNSFCDKEVIKKNNGCFEVMNIEVLRELAADVYK